MNRPYLVLSGYKICEHDHDRKVSPVERSGMGWVGGGENGLYLPVDAR